MRPRPWGQEGLLDFPSQVHIRSFLLRRGKRSLHFLPTLLLPLLPSPTLALSSVFQRRWRLAKRPRSSCDRSSLLILGVGVISHQSVRIHINAGRRWLEENTHQQGNYTSELAKHHVDAGFRSTQQMGQSAGFVVDADVYSTLGGISR